jgi:hypothetical protein
LIAKIPGIFDRYFASRLACSLRGPSNPRGAVICPAFFSM